MTKGPSWLDLFRIWDMVDADLHAVYGIDLADPPARSWFWLLARIRRLLLDPTSVTHRATTTGR